MIKTLLRDFAWYMVAMFTLYLMCLFTVGIIGHTFIVDFSLIFAATTIVCFPFFVGFKRMISQ